VQNRYAGDIGDYVKLAMLRHLSPGHRLGVAWWLFPDESHNTDGRHTAYLRDPRKWEGYDPELFANLKRLIASGTRSVAELERAARLPNATFVGEPLPVDVHWSERGSQRRNWFDRLQRTLADRSLIFLDPDNGLEPGNCSVTRRKAGKCVLLEELLSLRHSRRCLIVYHHQTRRKGGHLAEIGYQRDRLKNAGFNRIDVLRASPFSARAYFILDAPHDVRERAAEFAQRWSPHVTWHPSSRSD
jgi:hypothetical protein